MHFRAIVLPSLLLSTLITISSSGCGGGDGDGDGDAGGDVDGDSDVDGDVDEPDCDDGEEEERSCYHAAVVAPDQSCTYWTQTRTCSDGTWEPDWPDCEFLTCEVEGYESCGDTPHGNDETRLCYPSDTVLFGETCEAFTQTRTCNDGAWDPDWPDCEHPSCTVEAPAPCGGTPHGGEEQRDCFYAATVPYGETCSSTEQNRFCDNGAWNPDWPTCDYLSCTVDAPLDCGAVAHGSDENRPCYDAATVPYGETCTFTTQSRTCDNGAWNPDWLTCDYLSCTVEDASSCGATPHGNDETRSCYDSATVPYGETCTFTSQTRTCDDGSWSPDWPSCDHLSCVAMDPTSCAVFELAVPDSYSTIQGAINAASDGDTVCVFDGTYSETIDFSGKAITVFGFHGAAATIIDGGGVGPVVTFASSESSSAVLDGFTITGGAAALGAGIFAEGADPTLVRLIVSDNHSSDNGGGIYLHESVATVTDSTIADNSATDDGGGIYLWDADATVTNSIVRGNSAREQGGGVYAAVSSPALSNLLITGNSASGTAYESRGGGIAYFSSEGTITNVRIAGNSALYDGGITLYNSNATLTNVTIEGNRARLGGGLGSDRAEPLLINVTITNNTASGSTGGGMYVFPDYPLEYPIMSYCNLWGNSPDDLNTSWDPGPSNIDEDPEFLDISDSDGINWDLHLAATSALVNAGDPSILDPDGSTSDMGAYGGPAAELFDLDLDGFYEWWLPDPYSATTSSGMDCDDLDPAIAPGTGC